MDGSDGKKVGELLGYGEYYNSICHTTTALPLMSPAIILGLVSDVELAAGN